MHQIVSNLIDNTICYSTEKAEIRIALQQDNNEVSFIVSNTYQHIESYDIVLLSKPFYRIEESRSRHTGGYGLGLSIVKGLVEAHNSTLNMEY